METIQLLREKCLVCITVLRHLARNKECIPEEDFNEQLNDIKNMVIPSFDLLSIFEGKQYIYALELEESKIYVGWSEHLLERLRSHFQSGGSVWTKKFKPQRVKMIREGTKKDEDALTIEMMKKYGWRNVRGGKWTKMEIKNPLNTPDNSDHDQ